MFDPLFETNIHDYENFSAKQNYRVLEGIANMDGSGHSVQDHMLTEAEIIHWNQPNNSSSVSLQCQVKFILLEFSTRRISCSSSLFQELCRQWRLPNCAFDHLYTRRPVSLLFRDPPDTKTPKRIGILGPSINHQCVLVYEPSSRIMNAIFASSRTTAEMLTTWLRKAPELICHPSILILIVCEHILDVEVRRKIEVHSKSMDDDAELLGMVPNRPENSRVDEEHLRKAIRSLTLAVEGVAWFLSKLDRLEGTIQALEEFRSYCGPHASSQAHDKQLSEEFSQRVGAMRARMAGYRHLAGRVQKQGEAMAQTVFCLIGTNDNRLNYQAAEASIHIAEESRRIADDSKKVAILTRRDSNDMRVIAAVTLMFLPGTFVATFFSTSFLNFLADEGNTRYSSLGLGLYWAVTIALTLIVLGGWIVVSRIQSAKDKELLATSQ